MPSVLLIGLIVGFIVIGLMISATEETAGPVIGGVILAIPLIIWVSIASTVPFEGYESNTYAIHQVEDAQVANVDGSFININSKFGKVATSTEVLKITEPINQWAGGIYWMGIWTEYELIENEK